jgi:hypothetical protein
MSMKQARYAFKFLAEQMSLSRTQFYEWEKKGYLPVRIVNGEKTVPASVAKPLIQIWLATCTSAEFGRLTGWKKNSVGYLIRAKLIRAEKVHGLWRPCRSSIEHARRLASQHERNVRKMSFGHFFDQLASKPPNLTSATLNFTKTADYFGVSRDTIKTWILENKLQTTYHKGRWVVFTSSIKRLRKRFLVEFKDKLRGSRGKH